MANPEKNRGHAKFICAISQEDGKQFGLQFDPGIFYDEATKIMLRSQINYILSGTGHVIITLSDLEENRRRLKITLISLLESGKDRETVVSELFEEVRKENIVKVTILRKDIIAKKFINKGLTATIDSL